MCSDFESTEKRLDHLQTPGYLPTVQNTLERAKSWWFSPALTPRSILKVEGFGTHRSVIIFIKQTQRKIQTQHTNTYTNTNTKKKYKHKHKYKYRFKHEQRFKLNWNHISLIFHFLLFVVLEVLLMRKIDEQEFPGICTNEQNIGWNNVHSAVVLLKWAPVFINSFPAVNDLVNQNLTWV